MPDTIDVAVMFVRLNACTAPAVWLAPISRPIKSTARPFEPEVAYAIVTAPVVGTRRMRDFGGLGSLEISDT